MSEFELFLAMALLTALATLVNLKTRSSKAVQAFSYLVFLLAFASATGLAFATLAGRLL